MLGRVTFAAAVLAFAGPALADEMCVPGVSGVPCDVVLQAYRANDVPAGATDLMANEPFVAESLHDHLPDAGAESPTGEDVLYWDGDTAMVVPEETGPRVSIATGKPMKVRGSTAPLLG